MKKSMIKPFLQDLSKFEQIAPKILKKFRQIYLRFIIYCSHKGFYDRPAFIIQAFHAVFFFFYVREGGRGGGGEGVDCGGESTPINIREYFKNG